MVQKNAVDLELDKLLLRVQFLEQENELLRSMVYHDDLTGLCSRKRFEESLEEKFEGLQMGLNECLALYIVDLDFFKKVNDVHGHDAGDEVLLCAAKAVQDVVHIIAGLGRRSRGDASIEVNRREHGYDTVARWGGEEFVVISIDPIDPLDIAEKMRVAIENTFFPAYPDLRVTASIGFTVVTRVELETCIDKRDLFRSADAALYAAKRSGRNRVVQLRACSQAPLSTLVV